MIDINLFEEYRQAVRRIEKDPDEKIEEKILAVLKEIVWSSTVIREWDVDKEHADLYRYILSMIAYVGMEERYREDVCLMRIRQLSAEQQTGILECVRYLNTYFSEEYEKQMRNYSNT